MPAIGDTIRWWGATDAERARSLTADEVEIGDVWSRIFRGWAFEPGESVTLEHRGPVFGHVAMTYRVTPRGASGSRLVMRLAFRAPGPGPVRRLVTAALSAGDLVMARRQLLNLKRLAEAQQAR